VTDVDVGISLNVVNVLAVQSQLMAATLDWAHNPCRHSVAEFEWTSDRDDPLAGTQLTGVA